MRSSSYAEVFRQPQVRRILVLATVIRIPLWAAGVVLTLHVVGHLGRSYAAAGVIDMAYAAALGVSGPWRGRRLDRIGLRRTVAPSLAVLTVCWSIAPWVGYLPLLGLVVVAGVFTVPQFSIVRLVLIGAVPPERRTTVLAVDSVMVEVSFMIGPVLGVLAATMLPTTWALLLCQLLAVVGAGWLWLENPSLGRDAGADPSVRHSVRSWLSPTVVGVLLVAVAATVVLNGEDLATVAALRSMDHTRSIGWVLALWGLSSAIGGIVYGALPRHPPSYLLIGMLAASTLLVPLADGRAEFAALLFLTGFFCAPTITATVDDLSRKVPPSVRGEAMGWHGSAMTLGGAIGAPLIGVAIDGGGWQSGFEVAAVVGLGIGVAAFVARRLDRRPPLPEGTGHVEPHPEVAAPPTVPLG